jgi:hypothetical protein
MCLKPLVQALNLLCVHVNQAYVLYLRGLYFNLLVETLAYFVPTLPVSAYVCFFAGHAFHVNSEYLFHHHICKLAACCHPSIRCQHSAHCYIPDTVRAWYQ